MAFTDLEEIIFQEISEWFVGRNCPPGIMVKVQHSQQGHQDEGRQLGLITENDQHHQNRSNDVLDHLPHTQLESDQGDEHEGQQDATGELHEVLGLVVAHGWHAGEQAATLDSGLGQYEEQSAYQGKVP